MIWPFRQEPTDVEKPHQIAEALNKLVNGDDAPKRWMIAMYCSNDKEYMTVDAATPGRFICPKCGGIAVAQAEKMPYK